MTTAGFRELLKNRAPMAYKAALLSKNWIAGHARGRGERKSVARLVANRTPLAADIDGRVGMGGLLTWAGRALLVGEQKGVDVALRFTAPTYMPAEPVDDWLDCYFERLGSRVDNRPVVKVGLLPTSREPESSELGRLVWSALRIRPEIVNLANQATPDGRFASVHYRGSDKYLEAPRVGARAVLDRVDEEMRRDGLDQLFIASDEPTFIDEATRRFGAAANFLECEATAVGNVPPHMSSVPGETKAAEALATMLILSRAKLLVRTVSLLSEWATTIPGERRVVVVRP